MQLAGSAQAGREFDVRLREAKEGQAPAVDARGIKDPSTSMRGARNQAVSRICRRRRKQPGVCIQRSALALRQALRSPIQWVHPIEVSKLPNYVGGRRKQQLARRGESATEAEKEEKKR